jgi:hypothetical protein
MIAGIIRNMHLAIAAGETAIHIEHRGGVVIDTAATAFKQRCHNHDTEFSGDLTE